MLATVTPFNRVFRIKENGDLERVVIQDIPLNLRTFFTEMGFRIVERIHPNSRYVLRTDGNVYCLPKHYILRQDESNVSAAFLRYFLCKIISFIDLYKLIYILNARNLYKSFYI